MTIGSATSFPAELTVVNQPDFTYVSSSLTNVEQGVYEFSVTVENIGDDATTSTVPISWEKMMYTLPMVSGSGTLDESAVDLDMDLNGDGDKVDTFSVTWFQNATRSSDATINNGTHDIHVYSLNEGTFGLGVNRTYYIKGRPKLFHLGSETHTLYTAGDTSAIFGLGDAKILQHPSPNFELALYDKMEVTDLSINGNPVRVQHTWTGIDSGRNLSTFIVPSVASGIAAGEQSTFSCKLYPGKTKSSEILLIMNWSPDGQSTRHIWVPYDQYDPVEAINRPYFLPIDSAITSVSTGVYQLEATTKNVGAPATTGTVPIHWAPLYYGLQLTNGVGTLEENDADYDLNGDGDKDDTFDVSWNNSIRPWDATIDGNYVYALSDLSQEVGNINRSYFIGGNPKIFTLGTESHILQRAWNDMAWFALGASIQQHPSPNLELAFNLNTSVTDFKINGNPVDVNHASVEEERNPDGTINNLTAFIIPNVVSEIKTGEEVTVSCTLTPQESQINLWYFIVNWSPDGIRRIMWILVDAEEFTFVAASPTATTTTTTTTTTTNIGTPGFSFIVTILIMIPLFFYKGRKKTL
ncbi:MAG: hypothetical protein ACFFFG_14690 [Candidatus Thorarchaeota archaeon]